MSKSKVIISGGSGFLGKAVNKTLKDNLFYDVVSLGGKRDYDLTNQKQVDYLYKEHEPDVIVHLAARVGGIGANKDNPGLFMYENLVMGMNLIETARKYGKLQKFVMVGTVCAYPKFTPVPFVEEDLWNGYPEETNAPYGIAKKALMQMVMSYKEQYGFNGINLIPIGKDELLIGATLEPGEKTNQSNLMKMKSLSLLSEFNNSNIFQAVSKI